MGFNHSGLWLIDDDEYHNASSTDALNDTVPAWFWVNSSNTITHTVDDNSFEYGDTGSLTFTSSRENARLAVSNQTGRLLAGWNSNFPYGFIPNPAGQVIITKNSSWFSNAGVWYMNTYEDKPDEGLNDFNTYADGAGGNGYNWYNETTYGTAGAFTSSYPDGPADSYAHASAGPWDPPEWNATTYKKITVNTGTPNIAVTNVSTLYWGIDVRIDVNVTDNYGQAINGCNISLRNQSGSEVIFRGDYSDIWINGTGAVSYTHLTLPTN